MFDIIYIDFRTFNYYLNDVDITEDLIEFFDQFDENNFFNLELNDYLSLICRPDIITVDYMNAEVQIKSCELFE